MVSTHDQLTLDGGAVVVDNATGARVATGAAGAEIRRMAATGLGWTAIARSLNARGVPTPSGRGAWWAQTVRRHVDPTGWAAYMRSYRAGRPRAGR